MMVKIVRFSMTGMCHNQIRQFQHDWNLSWSKLSVSGRLEGVMVKYKNPEKRELYKESDYVAPGSFCCVNNAAHFNISVRAGPCSF
jgi:hypothetical protein